MYSFRPLANTQAVASNSTSQFILLPTIASGKAIEFQNVGNTECFVVWGNSTNANTAYIANSTANGSYPIQGYQSKVVHRLGADRVAVVSSGAVTLYITIGDGE